MTPKTGQHVKCILRNGAIADGIVEEWFNNHVQLKALDGESILIITHPSEDIMLIKIILDSTEEPVPEPPPFVPEPERWEDQERGTWDLETMQREFRERLYAPGMDPEKKFEEAVAAHDPNKPEDRKTIAEMKVELNKAERDIIASKLRDHRPGPYKSAYQPSTTPYHYPAINDLNKSAYKPGRIPNGHSRHSKKQGPK